MKKMKKIETNTSKKPMKRLIALWVVFVMLIVPFANHVGKNDVKAEGESGTPSTGYAGTKTANVQSFAYDLQLNREISSSGDESNGYKYNVPADASPQQKTVTLVQGVQTVEISTNITITNASETSMVVGVKYMIAELEDSLPGTIAAADAVNIANLKDTTDIVNTSKKIGVYAYAYDPDDSAQTPSDSYTLQYMFNVNFVETAFASNDTKFIDTEYKKETTEVKAGNGQTFAGAGIKYAICTEQQVDPENLSYSEYNTFSGKNGKLVYVYAALVSNNENKVLEYKYLGSTHVTNDKQAPTIALNKVEQSSDGTTFGALDEGHTDENNVYYGNKAYYRYTFKVTDDAAENQDASGVKEVKAKVGVNGTETTLAADPNDSTLYTYVVCGDALTGDGDHTVYVTAADNAGNPTASDYACGIKIQQVTDKTTVESVKLAADDTWDGLGNSAKTIKKLNKQTNIIVTLNSTKKLTKVTLGTGYEYDVSENDISTDNIQRVYTIQAKFPIPKDINTSETIKDLKVSAFVGDDEQIAEAEKKPLAQITYDAKAPVISNAKDRKSVV